MLYYSLKSFKNLLVCKKCVLLYSVFFISIRFKVSKKKWLLVRVAIFISNLFFIGVVLYIDGLDKK